MYPSDSKLFTMRVRLETTHKAPIAVLPLELGWPKHIALSLQRFADAVPRQSGRQALTLPLGLSLYILMLWSVLSGYLSPVGLCVESVESLVIRMLLFDVVILSRLTECMSDGLFCWNVFNNTKKSLLVMVVYTKLLIKHGGLILDGYLTSY